MSYSDNEPTVAAMERVIKQRDEAIRQRDEAEAGVERLKRDVASYMSQVMPLREALNNVNNRYSESDREVERLRAEQESHDEDGWVYRGEYDRVVAEVERLIADNRRAEETNERLRAENRLVAAANAEARHEVEKLRVYQASGLIGVGGASSMGMTHNAELEAEVEGLREENQLLKTRPNYFFKDARMKEIEAEVERLRAVLERAEKETHICGPKSPYSEDECPGHRIRNALAEEKE